MEKTKFFSELLRVVREYGLNLLLVLCGGIVSQNPSSTNLFFDWWEIGISNLFVCVLCLLAIMLVKPQSKEEIIFRVLIFVALQWPLVLCALNENCRNEVATVVQFTSVAIPLSVILTRIIIVAVAFLMETLLSWYLLYITYHIQLPLEDGSDVYIGPKGGKFYWKNGRKKYIKK